ncbi:MAG: cadherin-like domain-containing protein, partial [Nanoarchaeota archaeon]
TLVVGWTYSDGENDPQQGNETLWYINGIENASLRNLTSISSSNTTKNQNWSFSVRVFDGTDFSDFVNSTSLIIQNSAPIHTTPSITSNDEHKRFNGTLMCSNQSTLDLDMDIVSNFVKWYKNDVLIETAINLTTLSVGNYTKGDNLTCEITPNDGSVNGISLNSTNFTVLNAAPFLNNSLQNKAWDENTIATINLLNGFVDIDDDNMTYNATDLSNIALSINNNIGVATLSPDSNFNGVRYIIFFAFDGTNLTSSNNVTLTVNDVQEPSPEDEDTGNGGGGGGGISGAGKYTCKLDWHCSPWTSCEDEKQTRECKLEDVSAFRSLEKCPQNIIPEQERSCKIKADVKASCNDEIQNQNEEGIDCGGSCGPCFVIGTKEEETKESDVSTGLTGAVVGTPFGNAKKYGWLVTLLIIALGLFSYYKFRKKPLQAQPETPPKTPPYLETEGTDPLLRYQK